MEGTKELRGNFKQGAATVKFLNMIKDDPTLLLKRSKRHTVWKPKGHSRDLCDGDSYQRNIQKREKLQSHSSWETIKTYMKFRIPFKTGSSLGANKKWRHVHATPP